MMNIELTTNNKIEFLKEMIKELELKQTEVVQAKMTKPFEAEQPSIFELTDNKHIETTYGPQWLLVQKVWGDSKRNKICFKLTPSWSDNTLVKVIKMKNYKFIAQNMVKRLFNKDYTQFGKLLNTLENGLTGKFVFAEVNQGKSPEYAYSIGDFQMVTDVITDQSWDNTENVAVKKKPTYDDFIKARRVNKAILSFIRDNVKVVNNKYVAHIKNDMLLDAVNSEFDCNRLTINTYFFRLKEQGWFLNVSSYSGPDSDRIIEIDPSIYFDDQEVLFI